MKKEIYVIPGASPNQGLPPSREIYGAMGEENIFRMLSDFYAKLGQSDIKDMFPKNLEKASQKSARFFVGLLGGPPLYHQMHGSPMMRGRHMPFTITEHGRDVWLECFASVLENAPEKYNFPPQHLPGFYAFLRDFSLWMVNSREE